LISKSAHRPYLSEDFGYLSFPTANRGAIRQPVQMGLPPTPGTHEKSKIEENDLIIADYTDQLYYRA